MVSVFTKILFLVTSISVFILGLDPLLPYVHTRNVELVVVIVT